MKAKPPQARPTETAVRAWARLAKAQQMALGLIEKALKKAKLPPLAWYDVLLELERTGKAGLRPFELQQEMLLEQYNLSRLIDRLVKKGYVQRETCEDDGRGQVLIITPSGKKLRRRMWPIYAAAIQSAMGSRLSDAQTEALDTLLGVMLEQTLISIKSRSSATNQKSEQKPAGNS